MAVAAMATADVAGKATKKNKFINHFDIIPRRKRGFFMIKQKKYFILDFDSTFVKSEGLEELAEVSLAQDPKRKIVLEKIRELTKRGMEGKISFGVSLNKRLRLLKANKVHIEKVVRILKKKVSRSILRNKHFFQQYAKRVYIVSGGFKEFVIPVVTPFGVSESHVFANNLLFDRKGNILGYNRKNPLSKTGGKVKVVKDLRLNGKIYVIGDGYTDYQIKELGIADKFVAFTENISRGMIAKRADDIASSFDEFLYVNKLPMSISYPKNRLRVLLLESIHNQAVQIFEKEGYEVMWYEKALSEEELIRKLDHVKILGIRSNTAVTSSVISAASKLLTIGAFCIGTDQKAPMVKSLEAAE